MLNIKISKTAGRDRPVVFLHGFLESMSMWEELDLDFSAVYVDLPGHGGSVLDPSIKTIRSMAKSVLDTLRSSEIDEYDLVGHSMGGYVGLEMKAMDSNCKKLCLLNSNFWTDSEQKKNDRMRIAELVKTKKDVFIREAIPNLFCSPSAHQEKVEDLISESCKMTSESIAASSIAMSTRHDFSEQIMRWKDDVLVVQGELDTVVPNELMKEKVKGAQVQCVNLPTGHMAHIECTDEVNSTLRSFIKKPDTQ
jgi:pimeloyl-ACP methyl ester carboxylesterase